MSDLRTIRTDVVGSLLRPAAVKEARAQLERARSTPRAAPHRGRRGPLCDQAPGKHRPRRHQRRRDAPAEFPGQFWRGGGRLRRRASTMQVYTQRVENGTALRRWEMPTQEKGTAISHRRPVKSRLKLTRNVPLEEYKFVARRREDAGEGCADRAGPHQPALRLIRIPRRSTRTWTPSWPTWSRSSARSSRALPTPAAATSTSMRRATPPMSTSLR